MFLALTTRFHVSPKPGEKLVSLRSRLIAATQEKFNNLLFEYEKGQDSDRSIERTMLPYRSEWQHSTQKELYHTKWILEYQVKGVKHEVEVQLGTNADRLCLNSLWRTSAQINPFLKPPPLLDGLANILRYEGCSTEDEYFDYRLNILSLETVADFAANVLNDPRRRTPLVMVSPTSIHGEYLIDVERLARRSFGLAQVYQLADVDTAVEFSALTTKRWGCHDGAIRLYWPIKEKDKADRHPFYLAKTLREMPEIEKQRGIFSALCEASRRDIAESDMLRQLPKLQREDEAERREKGNVSLDDAIKEWEKAERLKDRAEAHNVELAAALEILRSEKDAAEARASHYKDRTAQLESKLTNTSINPTVEHLLCLSLRAAATYREASPDQQKGFTTQINKLGTDLRKGRQVKTEDATKTDCRIFPRGKPGVRVHFYECPEGKVRICELSSHHDGTYNDLYDRGVFKENYALDTFEAWPLTS